jgi:hypothetical protein
VAPLSPTTAATQQQQQLPRQQDDLGEGVKLVPRALTFSEACAKYKLLAASADPLWFARAFAARAAVNVESMAAFVEKAFRGGE